MIILVMSLDVSMFSIYDPLLLLQFLYGIYKLYNFKGVWFCGLTVLSPRPLAQLLTKNVPHYNDSFFLLKLNKK